MARRRKARGLATHSTLRRFAEEPPPGEKADEPGGLPPPPSPESSATSESSTAPTLPSEPIDLEGSRRRLEERKVAWIELREAWMRARARRRALAEASRSGDPVASEQAP